MQASTSGSPCIYCDIAWVIILSLCHINYNMLVRHISTVTRCLWYDVLSMTFYLYHIGISYSRAQPANPQPSLYLQVQLKANPCVGASCQFKTCGTRFVCQSKCCGWWFIICWLWHIGYGTFVVTLLDRLIMPTTCNILCIPHDTIRTIAFCCSILLMPHYLCIPSYIWNVGWERLDWTYGSSYICWSLMAMWYRVWAYCLQHISCHRLDTTHLPWHPRYDRVAVTCWIILTAS